MKRVAVAMGGPSKEHDVSLASGRAVVAGLKEAGLSVLPLWIKRDTNVVFSLPSDQKKDLGVSLCKALDSMTDIDCVFIAMHGPFGEDGVFQAMLEARGIPFTGSDHVGASISMDKILSKRVYESVGLTVPPYRVLKAGYCKSDAGVRQVAQKTAEELGIPIVLKTPRLGSSVGIAIVHTMDELINQLQRLAGMDSHILAEGFISGREFTVPVLEEDGQAYALPIIEIKVHSHGFFDYETKYDPNMVDEVCPAPIPEQLSKRLSQLGIVAHETLMLSGLSRSDFIVDEKGRIYILETNSIPGLTEVSLFPKAATVAGIGFPDLLMRLCQAAVSRQ